jgi:hypothetical protein
MRSAVSLFLLLSLFTIRAGLGRELAGLDAGMQAGSANANPQQDDQAQTTDKLPLTNLDIINMVHAGLGDPSVIPAIRTNPTVFDTSPEGINFLKREGVSEGIIKAMIAAGSGKPAPALAPAVPASPTPPPPAPAPKPTPPKPAKPIVQSGTVEAPKPVKTDIRKVRKVALEIDWADEEYARARATLAIQKHTCLKVVDTLADADARLNWTNQGVMGVAIRLLSKDDKDDHVLWSKTGLTPPLKALNKEVGCQ